MTVSRYSSQIGLYRRPGDYSQAEDQITWPTSTEIDLTQEMCRYVGSEPIRYGTAFPMRIACYRGDEDGTLSNINLGITRGSAAAVKLKIWSQETKAAAADITVTVDSDGGSGWEHTGSLTIPATISPGRYRCALVITWPAGATWTHCEGTLDVVQRVPA